MTITAKHVFGRAPAVIAALAVALSTVPATPASADDEAVPQGHTGVARLSTIAGDVELRRGDSNDAVDAAQNAPVNVGDYLSTRSDARAEIEFDYASLVRLAPQTQIRFVKLDQHAHELQLAEGTVELRVLRGLDAHPVVDTPGASILPDRAGSYRITVTHDGDTEVTARSGQADVEVGDANERHTIYPGSSLLVSGQGANARVSSIQTLADDDFDRWGDERDAHWQNVDTAYVDHGIVGAEDLDRYGRWVNTPDYGQAWQPTNEPAGWAPYTDGRWVWEPSYAWTWVGNEPWGYAPYHYGRWAFIDDGWYWVPGPYDAGDSYAYAPAYVGFFGYGDDYGGGGGGGGININLSFGNIGWTPLAPFEGLTAWWGNLASNLFGGLGGNGYGTYGRAGYGSYHNIAARGGANGISSGSFASGNFEHIQPLAGNLLHGITSVVGALPVVPTAHNLAPGGITHEPRDGVEPISRNFANLQPITTLASFAEQRRSVAATIEQQLPGLTNIAGLSERSASNESGYERTANDGTRTNGTSTAWQRFEPTQRGSYDPSPQSGRYGFEDSRNERPAEHLESTNRDVWSRFGTPGGEAPRSDRVNEPSYAIHSSTGSDRSYSEASRSYSEPSRSYSAPSRSYSVPSRSYSAPSRSYSEPSRSYSAPPHSYSAPHTSSGGNHGSSGHSDKRH